MKQIDEKTRLYLIEKYLGFFTRLYIYILGGLSTSDSINYHNIFDLHRLQIMFWDPKEPIWLTQPECDEKVEELLEYGLLEKTEFRDKAGVRYAYNITDKANEIFLDLCKL